MTINAESGEVKSEHREIIVWLSMLNMLFLITIIFAANFSDVTYYVDSLVLVCMFVQTAIICFSIPKKD